MTATRFLLALDASTPRSVIVVGRIDGDTDALLAFDEETAGGRQASERLADRIHTCIEQAGLSPRSLTDLAVGRGPGTFTGARVAVATTKGLALGLGLDVHPLSSLAAVAEDAAASGADEVLAVLDARRGEVYGARYRRTGGRLLSIGDERCVALAELAAHEDWPAGLRVHGPGVGPYRASLPEPWRSAATHDEGPTAQGLWAAAVASVRADAAVPARELEVVYLRVSYAEMGINTPKRPLKRSPFV